jgi:hypothetical protein
MHIMHVSSWCCVEAFDICWTLNVTVQCVVPTMNSAGGTVVRSLLGHGRYGESGGRQASPRGQGAAALRRCSQGGAAVEQGRTVPLSPDSHSNGLLVVVFRQARQAGAGSRTCSAWSRGCGEAALRRPAGEAPWQVQPHAGGAAPARLERGCRWRWGRFPCSGTRGRSRTRSWSSNANASPRVHVRHLLRLPLPLVRRHTTSLCAAVSTPSSSSSTRSVASTNASASSANALAINLQ